MSLNQALDTLRVLLPTYFDALKVVKDQPVTPIVDLSAFKLEGGSLNSTLFTNAFNSQVKTNFIHLQQLEKVCQQYRPHLNMVVSIIGDSNELKLGISWDGKKLEEVHAKAAQITDNLNDLLGYLDGHCKFVSQAVGVPIELFRHTRVLEFLLLHKEQFHQLYESDAATTFPVNTPNVFGLNSDELILRNNDDYRKAKACYDQLVEMAQRLKQGIPSQWPYSLVNLSTHDGEPKLDISSEQDFLLVITSYAEYQRQLENIRKSLTHELKATLNGLVKSELSYKCIGKN